jgi:hypothetical protein
LLQRDVERRLALLHIGENVGNHTWIYAHIGQ